MQKPESGLSLFNEPIVATLSQQFMHTFALSFVSPELPALYEARLKKTAKFLAAIRTNSDKLFKDQRNKSERKILIDRLDKILQQMKTGKQGVIEGLYGPNGAFTSWVTINRPGQRPPRLTTS